MTNGERGRAVFPPGEPVEWVQPSRFRREWELRIRGQRIARMVPRRRIGWDLTAESPAGHWAVRRLWPLGAELRSAREAEWPDEGVSPVARFKGGLVGSGTVWTDADELSWKRRFRPFRPGAFDLETASGFPLLTVERRLSLFKFEGTISLTDSGRRHPQIEPLVILSWAIALAAARRAARG